MPEFMGAIALPASYVNATKILACSEKFLKSSIWEIYHYFMYFFHVARESNF